MEQNYGTVSDVIYMWSRSGDLAYTLSGNVSRQGKQLYSYALLIAELFRAEDTSVALVLPHYSSTKTTNNHIRLAGLYAHDSVIIGNVFMVPDIDPLSADNLAYMHKQVDDALAVVLNRLEPHTRKRKHNYTSRVMAAMHYYDALTELYEYGCFAYLYNELSMPVPYVQETSLVDLIEEEDDYKFLGQLALEGDANDVHKMHNKYKDLTS